MSEEQQKGEVSLKEKAPKSQNTGIPSGSTADGRASEAPSEMLNTLNVYSHLVRKAYGLDADPVRHLLPDPDGIFESLQINGQPNERAILIAMQMTQGKELNGREKIGWIHRVKLRQGDEIVPMSKIKIMLSPSDTEIRYWFRRMILMPLTNKIFSADGMYYSGGGAGSNLHDYSCSRNEINVKGANLPRLMTYAEIVKAWKKHASANDVKDILEVSVHNWKCTPIKQNGDYAPRPCQPPYDDFYFRRSEIDEIAARHFGDVVSQDEIEAYALKITASKDYMLTEDQITELFHYRFPGCGLTKYSKKQFDPIMKKIKLENQLYNKRGRKRTPSPDKWNELVDKAKREAAASPLSPAAKSG